MRRRSLIAAALTAVALAGCPAVAQSRRMGGNRPKQQRPEKPAKPHKTPIDDFEKMSPEQRQQALDRLPPPQRQKLQERLNQFGQLPADQQRTLKTMYSRLNELPANRQESVRKSMNKFLQQKPERQQVMRDELKNIGGLSPEERQARMESPEFKSKFDKNEQGILRDMSDVLPPD